MTEKKEPKAPTHIIWQVIGEAEKARWIRIGSAWQNKDGKGLNLAFDSYPVLGRVVVRQLEDRRQPTDTPPSAEA